ncbi:CubicO group peptidase (beta-lactamase class C family) [Lysobacter niastensis]|uniref:CubicO group peptidase (Beta-lactamase class C family) n=1 Tax=Lysobacter niastensis TaxID=380629 RepID=A0ABU1W6T0_9GAMM|nr:serine hydrolase domain-containing protein [Lysobacter niastensis]MDR7133289.1 CubicO group peptidase (beta-lactamase class C family) [Lysobacter niastensis]
MSRFLWAAALWLASTTTQAVAAPPDEFIASYAREHDFSGSILVQQDGKAIYTRSFGLANIPFDQPNSSRTRYKIASITKLFTSTLILQLRDEGKIDLDQTIARYLPDYTGEAADKVTVRQLLHHTSGLPGYDQVKDAQSAIREGIPVYQLPHSSDELLSRYASGPLVTKPGSTFEYNNADYVVLGKIAEHVSGLSLEQALRQRILDPLQMHDSGLLRQDVIVARLADTYFHRDDSGKLTPDLPAYPENWYAAGAMYSTPGNLLVFANALFGGKLLSAQSQALMLEPGLDDYGLGLWVYETKANNRGYRVAKRPGRIMGAQAQLYRFLHSDTTVIILANTDAVDLDEFVAKIGREVMR